MKFNDDTRTRVLVDVKLTIDPAGTTPELKIDSTWYAATWQGSATHTAASGTLGTSTYKPEYWTQTARTNGYFAGPAVSSPAGAVVLTKGRHLTEVRVTSGSDIVGDGGQTPPIDVF